MYVADAHRNVRPWLALGMAFCLLLSIGCGDGRSPANAPAPPVTVPFDPGPIPTSRRATEWPFDQHSIWNMPIGSNAVYVAANTAAAEGVYADEDILVLTPDVPLVDIFFNDAGWTGRDRCPALGPSAMTAPIPSSLIIPSDGANYALAVLMPDRHTIRQTQPLAHCTAGGPFTSWVVFDNADLFADGIQGAHGGSGLSSIGGTIRVGELAPRAPGIRHALKINLDAQHSLWACKTPSDCYRWPADKADGYAIGYYGGTNPALKMGALLALPPSLDINKMELETEAAVRLAWTLQNYGGYVVDDTFSNNYGVAFERGPNGRAKDLFQADWGFSPTIYSGSHPWLRDMKRLFSQLQVVDNNGPSSVGGGGTPREPLAPPFAP